MKLYDDVMLLWSESKCDISNKISQFQKIADKRIVWISCWWYNGKILSWDYIVKISVINIKPINLLMKGVIISKAIKDV